MLEAAQKRAAASRAQFGTAGGQQLGAPPKPQQPRGSLRTGRANHEALARDCDGECTSPRAGAAYGCSDDELAEFSEFLGCGAAAAAAARGGDRARGAEVSAAADSPEAMDLDPLSRARARSPDGAGDGRTTRRLCFGAGM